MCNLLFIRHVLIYKIVFISNSIYLYLYQEMFYSRRNYNYVGNGLIYKCKKEKYVFTRHNIQEIFIKYPTRNIYKIPNAKYL